VRLFAALELPEAVTAALDAWAAGVTAGADGLRAVPASSLHVTLAFLGERPDAEAEAIGAAVMAAADGRPVPGLALRRAAWLGRGPSVLAVDLADPAGACAGVQAAVAGALVALGAYVPEERAFRPHVTVARVRRGARVDRRAELPALPDAGTFAASAVTLFRSRLSPRGASYEALARAQLPTGSGSGSGSDPGPAS
jgi:2'-5' RNA ligase